MASFDGERLRKLRQSFRYSQAALGRTINPDDPVAHTTISMWELGKSEPGLANLIALAACFDVSTDYLLGISDEKAPRAGAVQASEIFEEAVTPPAQVPGVAVRHPDRRRRDRRTGQ